jgi:hypothetical protein
MALDMWNPKLQVRLEPSQPASINTHYGRLLALGDRCLARQFRVYWTAQVIESRQRRLGVGLKRLSDRIVRSAQIALAEA